VPISQFRWEREFWRVGYDLVAGVDEVGRGALAGPLVAAAVVFEQSVCERRSQRERIGRSVRDSKLMSRNGRDESLVLIQECASAIGIGMVECDELDVLGMTVANRLAMERAVFALGVEPQVLLLDALVTDLSMTQVGLIDGDARCLSVAAASIVAKVTRDRMMIELHEIDSRYGFDQHVGYGTKGHLGALRQYGPAAFHRRSFRPVQACLTRP
jgi:ribonuclease HII